MGFMKRCNAWQFLSSAVLLFAILFAQLPSVEAQELPTGKIIEKIECRADPSLSYALYLPSSYDRNKKWPVLFAFDPGARGLTPVEHFKDAAETYGYIVAGSNNSRNGPWAPSAKAILGMWNDVVGRFAIDERRIYATGFSGGARIANRLGYSLKGQIAGVVACGAGLPTEMTESPQPPPFVLFGTAGVEDFNFVEMKQLDRALDGFGAAHRFEFFEGGHAWAPSELCTRAIEWMEIQAIKKSLRQRDEPLIESLFKKEMERARAQEAAGLMYQASVSYSAVARDFKGLRDVAEFERKSASLKDSREVRQTLKQATEQEAEERRLSTELYSSRARLAGAALSTENDAVQLDSSYGSPSDQVSRTLIVGELRHTLADLKKRSETVQSTTDRALARRVLNQFLVSSYESAASLLDRKLFDRAAAVLELDSELMPDNPRVLFRLACAYSLKGDKKKSIEALKKSAQKGFSNIAELEGNKSLDAVRGEAAYKKLVEELKAKK